MSVLRDTDYRGKVIYNMGDGADTIADKISLWSGEVNTLSFGAGITASMITPVFGSATQSLTLNLGNGDSVNIGSVYETAVQSFRFADGTTLTLDELMAQAGEIAQIGTPADDYMDGTPFTDRIDGLGGNDYIYGWQSADTLLGGSGDDYLDSGDGNDALTGGTGNDNLSGGYGDDTYYFSPGDGTDVINDSAYAFQYEGDPLNETNTLVFGAGITPGMIHAVDDWGRIVLDLGSGDSVSIGYTDNLAIQRIIFTDGKVFSTESILSGAPVAQPIAEQVTYQDAQFGFTIPAGVFVDPTGDSMSYSATMADGSALPAWLAFDSVTQTFSGTPSNWDVGSLNLAVTATDVSGLSASSTFVLNVLNVNDAPIVINPLTDQSANAGQAFRFKLDENSLAGVGFLNDATDTGTTGEVSPGYDSYLSGSGGNDIYSFARGDGNVYINDWDNSPFDMVQLSAGIAPSDITVSQDGSSLVLSVNGTGDSLTLGSWLWSDSSKIEQIIFADGTAWGVNDLMAMAPLTPSAASDWLVGTAGNDTIYALAGDDYVRSAEGNDIVIGGAGHDSLLAGTGDDTVHAGSGNDWIEGDGGSDIMLGGDGMDEIYADSNYSDTANDLLDGGMGDDYFEASIANDLIIGGQGDDLIYADDGNDVTLFNRGDGIDTLGPYSTNEVPVGQRTDTVSLGGGITYSDLSLSRNLNNLVLNTGNGESITFRNWFDTSWQDNKNISMLQMIAEGMPGYDHNSADPLLNKRIQQFDFIGIANQFEAALAADPTITTWQLAPHLADFSLGGSDTAAIGGDMAYLYGKNGNLDGLSEVELRAQLNDAAFGTANQTLTKTTLGAGLGVFDDVDFIHGDTLTYSATLADGSALPSWLTFDAATQTFSGTPLNQDVGNLNVLVTATDSGGLSATSTFMLDVLNVNDAPVATNDSIVTHEDVVTTSIATADLLANDYDIDQGDTFALTGFDAVSANGNAVALDAAGNLMFDIGNRYQSLAAGQTATDSFSYTVADTAGATSTATVNITINGLNDGPVTQDDIAGMSQDTAQPASGNVLANDSDVDQGTVLSVANAGVIAGSYGSLALNADGSYSYTLDNALVQSLGAGQSVTETFTYQATDGIDTTPATLTVTINGTNDAPVTAAPIANQQTNEDTLFSFTVPANTFTDIDNGDVLIYSATLADGSALPSWLTFDAAMQTFSGIPSNWDVGGYSVTVTATDTGGLTASSVFSVDVANVNDAPTVSMALAGQSILEDAPFSFTVPAGTFNDVDFIHGDTLTYGATLADGTALPGWLTFDSATQTFSSTPGNEDVGSLNVLVTATDSGGLSASSAFSLNVVNVNDAPTANADSGAATEDGGAVLLDAATLLANDTDPDFIHGDMLNIVGVSQAASGAAVSLVNGAVQYDTGALFQSLGQGQTATDTFSYTVSDTAGATSTATVTMTVTGVNDAPVTADDAAAVQEDVTLVATGNVLSNDTDVDQGTVLSITNAGTLQGNYGNLTLNADGSYSYALDNPSTGSGQARAVVQGLMAGQTVTETFAYQATDGIATTPATLTVTITGTNDAPMAQNDVAAVDEDSLLSIQSGTLLANDTDADIGDTKALVGVDAVSAMGSSLSLVNGQVVYDHGGQFNSLMAGQSVLDSFSYTMLDSAGATSTATVNVTVTGVNDGPQANGDSATMGEDIPQTTLTAASLLANDTDPDTGDALSLSGFDAVTALGNAVSMDAAGNLVFDIGDRYQSLAQGGIVTDTFNYTITDTAGATSTAQVSMTIAGLNDAPVAVADTASVQEDLSIVATGNVLANDSDVDQGTILSVADAGIRTGNYGSLSLAADGSYTYTVDNASPVVQALGRDAQVAEHFGYTATDGMIGASAVLDVFLNGANDAPILVAPLTDQDFTFHKHFSWQVPDGSFTDIDQGDTLDYAATLADGSALPDWLSFDAATRTFSGETPKEVGFVDVRVTATDKVAATGSTAGSLSASDVFRISVSHGNEGVGNGEDAPPPGHDHNFNDGSGTSPGRPGAKGGKGYPDSAAHPNGNEPEDCSSDTKASKDDAHSQDSGDSDSRRTDELIRAWFEEESISEQYSSFGTLNQHGAWGGQIDRQVNRNVARGVSGDVSSEWERMNEQLKKHLGQSGGDEGIFAESGTGSRPFGLFGSGSHQGIPQLGMGNGQQMKALTGLNEGLERLG